MPNKDGKGPRGQGSMTGRGVGNCTDAKISNAQPNRTRSQHGRSRALGRFSK